MVEFRLLIQQGFSSEPNRQAFNQAQSPIDQGSYLIGTGMVILAIVLILFASKNYLGAYKSTKPNYIYHGIIYTASAAIVILSLIVFMCLVYVLRVNLYL